VRPGERPLILPITAYSGGHIAFTRPEDYFDCMCKFAIALNREDDGRFIAEVQEIPGALAYGATQAEALHALAERIEHGEDMLISETLDLPGRHYMNPVKTDFYDIIKKTNNENFAKFGHTLPIHPNRLSQIRAELHLKYHHNPNIGSLLDDIINEYLTSNTN